MAYKTAQKTLPKGSIKRKVVDTAGEAGNSPVGGKQAKLEFPVLSKTTNQQKNFDAALTSYVVNSIRPFSTVDDNNFKSLIAAANPSLKVMSRPTLMRHIKADEKRWKEVVKEQLKEVEHVSTTADIWSTHHHAYMGISCHYIGKDLERRSVLLAVKHFKSPHTAERVAEIISEVHEEFELRGEKIIATVTDNGSNMVKAFRVFGVSLLEDIEEEEEGDDTEPELLGNAELEVGGGEEGFDIPNVLLPKHYR